MVTGKRAFQADSDVSLIGAILNTEPAGLATLQPLTPPSLERLVKKCLAKHPDDRWDSAHDVADELRWITQSGASQPAISAEYPRRRRRGLGAVLGVASLAAAAMAGAAAVWLLRPSASRPALARLSLDVQPAEELNAGGVGGVRILRTRTPGGSRTALTWTPDGEAVVFVGRRGGTQQLYVRRLDAGVARPLAGTEGAQLPAVAADGQWVAFWAGGAIRKMPVGGGPAMDLMSDVRWPPAGLAWDSGGRLYFGRLGGGIWQIPLEGAPAAVTTPTEAETHILPWPLPGGRTLLYTVRKREWSWGEEEVVALTVSTGERKVVLKDATDARYVPTGHLVFLRRGTLFAVGFDAARLEVQGPAVAVLDPVAQALTEGDSGDITGAGQFALSATGTLVWLPSPVAPDEEVELVTVDRRGVVIPLQAPVGSYGGAVRLSPDGRRLAVTSRRLTDVGLWLCDVSRGTLTLVAEAGEAQWPVWAPDGQRLAFAWLKNGQRSLLTQPVDSTAPPQVLVSGVLCPSSWLHDGRYVAAVPPGGGDIQIVTVESGRASVRPFFESPHLERWPAFSPDGRWLAYGSNVTGRFEVYVRPYPGPGAPEQVSVNGGSNPAWNPNGRELFFLAPRQPGRGAMTSVEFEGESRPVIGQFKTLFEIDPAVLRVGCSPNRCYDVAPDGQHFYATRSRPATPVATVTHINLIQNWFEELKAKVPAGR